jgi:beta-glucosidase
MNRFPVAMRPHAQSGGRSNGPKRCFGLGPLCRLLSAATISVALSVAAQSSSPCSPSPCLYQNSSAPIGARVHDLIGRMTLDEKISQMVNRAAAVPRLGIPDYDWWNEGLHGVARDGYATNFPQSIGLAATWDTPLMGQIADVISTEARAKFKAAQQDGDRRRHTGLTFWSPNINIFRDPRWGRGMETYGEDPYLTSRMAVEFVRGLQGDNPDYLKVVSTPKHFAVHNGPEPLRHAFNVDVSDHDLEDTYLPAFRATVVEAHADSIMCAYSAMDGTPDCASTMLLQNHLRDDWKFDGYVVSDCDAVADIARGHHFARDNAHAAADALKAGDDLNCGRAYNSLGEALNEGLVSEADIDRALTRLFTARFRLGMFDADGKSPYADIPASENNTPAHRQLALQAARESIVLLKNDGTLPLRGSIHTIAVVGPDAEMLESIEGNYNATAPDPVLPLEGIEKQFGERTRIEYAQGSIFVEGAGAPIPSTALRPDASSRQSGLKGEYFDHPDFNGEPRLNRVDRSIDFDWNRVSPGQGIPASVFAVRWSGELVPPAPGDYTLNATGPKGRAKIYLDGKLIASGNESAVLHFADTMAHAIRVEYIHQSEDRDFELDWQPPEEALRDNAVKVAREADVVIAFVGLSPDLEGEEMHVKATGFDGGDRTRIELPEVQDKLVDALLGTGKPLVIVLMSGSAVALSATAQRAKAILEAWYPGEEGGDAIAETLAGQNNPAGRLPVTFYRSTDDLPPFTDYSMANRTYRYYTGPVLYPFGYGLSYSHFSIRNLRLSAKSIHAGDTLKANVVVTNISGRAGSEVVELYLAPPALPGAPHLSLEGLQRVQLDPGETRGISFDLHPRDMSIVSPAGKRIINSGQYRIWVGEGQPGFSHQGSAAEFRISGALDLQK